MILKYADDFRLSQSKFVLNISSDLIRSGVNIPHACYACGEDASFERMCKIIMGKSYVQFIVKNILKVHNRVHPMKREYVLGEDVNEKNPGAKRESNSWYKRVWEFDREHAWKAFQQGKIFTWKDVFQ